MCDTGSLVHDVMSSRYYKNDTFLQALRGFNPSFVWSSIWGAKALLLEGLKWRVGDGRDIRVCDDSWLPGDSSNLVLTPNLESSVDLRMANFIGEDGCWDPKALFIHLMEEDVVCVLDIPLSERKPKDVLYWWPTFDGIYSTKSGY